MGAEKLLDKGDMLYLPAGRSQPERIQLAFISDDEIDRLVGYVKCEAGSFEYEKSVCDEIARIAEEITPEKQTKKSESNGEYIEGFIEALRIAVSNGKVSTSLLQRKLAIGYGRATKYIDAMEEFGFIGPPNGQKPRDVLITSGELEKKLKKIGY